MSLPEFRAFQKVPRLFRPIVVTEKIDRTNGVIYVPEDPSEPLVAGSRTRWFTDGADNFGFAAWVREHERELRGLGPGTHFGEWWGSGIQRGYGLTKGARRFSLFNVSRWADKRPECCEIVPILASGTWDLVRPCLQLLTDKGSMAAPGFKPAEGVVVYHTAGNCLFKVTLEKDEEPKGASQA